MIDFMTKKRGTIMFVTDGHAAICGGRQEREPTTRMDPYYYYDKATMNLQGYNRQQRAYRSRSRRHYSQLQHSTTVHYRCHQCREEYQKSASFLHRYDSFGSLWTEDRSLFLSLIEPGQLISGSKMKSISVFRSPVYVRNILYRDGADGQFYSLPASVTSTSSSPMVSFVLTDVIHCQLDYKNEKYVNTIEYSTGPHNHQDSLVTTNLLNMTSYNGIKEDPVLEDPSNENHMLSQDDLAKIYTNISRKRILSKVQYPISFSGKEEEDDSNSKRLTEKKDSKASIKRSKQDILTQTSPEDLGENSYISLQTDENNNNEDERVYSSIQFEACGTKKVNPMFSERNEICEIMLDAVFHACEVAANHAASSSSCGYCGEFVRQFDHDIHLLLERSEKKFPTQHQHKPFCHVHHHNHEDFDGSIFDSERGFGPYFYRNAAAVAAAAAAKPEDNRRMKIMSQVLVITLAILLLVIIVIILTLFFHERL